MKTHRRRQAVVAASVLSLAIAGTLPAAAFLPSAGDLLQGVNVRVGGQEIDLGGLLDDAIAGGGSFLGNLGSTIRGILLGQNPCISQDIGGVPAQFCPFAGTEIADILGPLGLPDTQAVNNRVMEILERELGAAPGDRRSGGAFGLNPAHYSLIQGREERQLAIQAVVDSRLSEVGQMQVIEQGEQVARATVQSLETSATVQGQIITQEIMKGIAAQNAQEAIANYQIYSQLAANGATGLYAMGVLNDVRGHLDRQEERRIVQTGTALTQTFNDYAAFAAALPQ